MVHYSSYEEKEIKVLAQALNAMILSLEINNKVSSVSILSLENFKLPKSTSHI